MSGGDLRDGGVMGERDVLWLGCLGGHHKWSFTGGSNAGCGKDCACSVPVHECADCGDCDYGDNDEADDIRRCCVEMRGDAG